uniref:Uncharacterized protein n=1 Tax=Anguilla anguilla TaxID=7936 RepID=A0A0E9QKY4_ANGAN
MENHKSDCNRRERKRSAPNHRACLTSCAVTCYLLFDTLYTVMTFSVKSMD